ncbi:MAG: VOC family protein [Herpetosiphonaceae bacterium]|nr:VOC family protein [Herpetosiphonaceae bacterium]
MQLDHLVILVPDLYIAILDYTTLGFTVTPGGAHADGLTENALIPFADGSYLELIAFNDPGTPQLHRWWRFVGMGSGLIDYALGCSALQAEIDMLSSKQIAFDGPHPNGRQRPDGTELRWLGAFAPEGQGLPFLIEDRTPRNLRVPTGDATQHPNGVLGVSRVVVGVTDLQATAEHYGLLLDERPSDRAHDVDLAADIVHLPLSQATLVLAQPTEHASPLAAQLAARGPGMYAAGLTVAPEQATGWLEPRRTHGARLQLV